MQELAEGLPKPLEPARLRVRNCLIKYEKLRKRKINSPKQGKVDKQTEEEKLKEFKNVTNLQNLEIRNFPTDLIYNYIKYLPWQAQREEEAGSVACGQSRKAVTRPCNPIS